MKLADVWISLAEKYGTPLVAVDSNSIREMCTAFRRDIPYADLYYSLKSNYNPSILKLITQSGFGVDAVSPWEVELALRTGVPADKIIYVENNMSDAEMLFAKSSGVSLVIGSLSRLEAFCTTFPGSTVGVRLNCDIGAAQHPGAFTGGPESKFGIHHSNISDILDISKRADVQIDLVHQHVGSGWLDQNTFVAAAEALISHAKAFEYVRQLDFGGGFGVPYSDEETPIDLQMIGSSIKRAVQYLENNLGRSIRIAFEPGRFLIAKSSVLLATVNDVKYGSDGRVFLGLDTGFNHLIRPALYGAPHKIVNLDKIERENGELNLYEISGNICESTDFFAHRYPLPKTERGDRLAILDVGAYGLSMGSNYNLRALPPEILWDGTDDVVIRRRQTLDDILTTFII